MTQTPDGWVPTADVTEAIQPWIAEVSEPTASLYARPSAGEGTIRDVSEGDLVRVTGVLLRTDGDPNHWWATTDGHIVPAFNQEHRQPRPLNSGLPSADDATGGWWGIAQPANVRAARSSDAPIVGEFSGGEHVKVLSDVQSDDLDGNSTWYRIDGGRSRPQLIDRPSARSTADGGASAPGNRQ